MLLCYSVDVKYGQRRWSILFEAKTGKGAWEDRTNMKDRSKNLYTTAHLFVSAIRVWEYQNNTPPALEHISHMLAMSIERTNYICRKLKEMGIVDNVEGSFGNRLFIRDHLKIEEIPREDDESKLEEELKKFKESQKGLSQKIETIQARQAQKKKDLFAEMEKKLKQELDKKA
jgi:hypothetical protein